MLLSKEMYNRESKVRYSLEHLGHVCITQGPNSEITLWNLVFEQTTFQSPAQCSKPAEPLTTPIITQQMEKEEKKNWLLDSSTHRPPALVTKVLRVV